MIWQAFPEFDRGYSPFRELSRLQREMNGLLSGFRGRGYEFPEVNVWADENEAVLKSEVPGVEPDDLEVTVHGNVLTLEGERKEPALAEEQSYQRRERGTGHFVRSVRLPYEVNPERIEASLRHGVLTVRVPRREESKPRKISVAQA